MSFDFFSFDSAELDWGKGDGLLPVIVQDFESLRVLMLGYMNKEALAATQATGLVTFYSRRHQRLWTKGETSGHYLDCKAIYRDCDQDTLLIYAHPRGETCHRGTRTCFDRDESPARADISVLADLRRTIKKRRACGGSESYTTRLFAEGVVRIAQKVGEEGVETALAAATQDAKLPEEAADLLYHLLVLLEAAGDVWPDVLRVLQARAEK